MKKTIYLKSIILLCTLLAGVLSVHADDVVYEWQKVTNLSDVATGDEVVIVDEGANIALPNDDSDFTGVSVTITDNMLTGDVPTNIQWTLTKDNYGYLTFERSDENKLRGTCQVSGSQLNVGNNTDYSDLFQFRNYGSSGGQLANEGANNYFYDYVYWYNNQARITGSSSQAASLTLYKKVEVQKIVKWKKVDDTNVTLSNDDVVVIVDLATGRAMSNDKGTKDPDAVSVDLNIDKDRILGDVDEKLQWTFTNNGGKYKFAVGENNLYANSEALKVGTETTNNEFDFSNNDNGPYMGITIDETQYFAGVDASMFSNVWKLVKGDDDKAKNTQPAIFKKVEDYQIIATIDLAENFAGNKDEVLTLNATCTGADVSEIQWTSSNTDVATVNESGEVTLKKRGTVVITASVPETASHDKASAKCTVRIDDPNSTEPGSINNPFTVAQVQELIKSEATPKQVTIGDVTVTWEEGVNYYIKGKVSKVNSGMMAMFGDMDFGSMGGESGSGMDFDEMMDDMDFDMDSMGDMGFDMSSMGFDMSALFGSSDAVTYYISDDGTKGNQLKVLNGRGAMTSNGDAAEYEEAPNMSPGDCVVVCGPLVESEDTNMLSSLMGGSEDPKTSWKVGELNYQYQFDPTLLVQDKEVYVNKTLDGKVSDTNPLEGSEVYSIDNLFDFYNENKIADVTKIQAPTYKSSDEEIAKWDEDTKKIVGVQEGTAKITVKVKVIVQEADDTADPKVEEKSYTMKRKFKLTVKSRDLDPAGYYDGDYVLTTSTDDLEAGTRLILVGTRVKDDKETDYVMGENNSMMGGGKSGSKYEFSDTSKEKIPCEDAPDGTLEVVLEKADDTSWYLNVGEDENGNKLYLYASDTSEETTEETTEDPEEDDNKFDFSKMMEMFNPTSGLKVATMSEAIADSCKAIISFEGNIATIKYTKTEGKNNTIMLSSAFDMESMMSMFSSNEEQTGDEQTEDENTFDMGSFDMFMASFNTKKSGDETPEEGKAQKNFMPRIYRFVPDPTFDINIGATGWKTIVTYKDVEVPENVEAYIVTKVTPDGNRYKASLTEVKNKQLKGGEPYLLHITSGNSGDYTMTLLDTEVSASENLLKVSDKKTAGNDQSSSVYVLANKSLGVGFYRWVGDDLGSGRVYLPIDGTSDTGGGSAKTTGFCNFLIETAIDNIEKPKSDVKQYYNLNGQRVAKPTQKGVYIVNGKTVVVK